jgi:hypothetical protein
MNNLPKRVAELFAELLQVPLPERDTCLVRVCGEDEALRQRLKNLLAANDELGDFLEKPLLKMSEKPGDPQLAILYTLVVVTIILLGGGPLSLDLKLQKTRTLNLKGTTP